MDRYLHFGAFLLVAVQSVDRYRHRDTYFFRCRQREAGCNKAPIYTITQWTGHSSLKTMKPYMAIVDKVKKESMKKFDEV